MVIFTYLFLNKLCPKSPWVYSFSFAYGIVRKLTCWLLAELELAWAGGVLAHPRLWVSQVSAGTLLAVGQFPAEWPVPKEDALPCSPYYCQYTSPFIFCFIRAPHHRRITSS